MCLWCIGDTFFTCIYIYIYWCFCLAFKGLPHLLWIRKSRRQCSSDLVNVKYLWWSCDQWTEWSITHAAGVELAIYPTSIFCSAHFRSSPFMSAHETGQWQALYTAYTLAHTEWSAWWAFAENMLILYIWNANIAVVAWYNLAQWNLLMLRWTLFFWFHVC